MDINEEIVTKILSVKQDANDFKILKWQVEDNIIKSGYNFCSKICRLTIDYEKSSKTFKQNVFLKIPHENAEDSPFAGVPIYDKEPFLYGQLLPEIYSLEEEYFTPRSYYIGENKSLFLKDLSQTGYKMCNRTEQLDFQHCYYALKTLAKWHAYTVKLNQSAILPDFVKNTIVYTPSNPNNMMKAAFTAGLDGFINQLESSIKEKYAKEVNILKGLNWDKIVNDMVPRPNSFNVLIHGDFSTVNLMFKYDKYGNVKKVKFIDFQLCRWASPAVDLIQFMVTSMKYEVYKQHIDLLLQVYLETLNNTLKGLGCGTYAMNDLRNDIEQKYMYTFGLITSALPMILTDPSEIPFPLEEIKGMVERGEIDMATIGNMFKNQQQRHLQIGTEWFLQYAQKGVFDSWR